MESEKSNESLLFAPRHFVANPVAKHIIAIKPGETPPAGYHDLKDCPHLLKEIRAGHTLPSEDSYTLQDDAVRRWYAGHYLNPNE